MSTETRSLDVTDSVELLDLAEEVRRSGVGRLLVRGEQELALIVPIARGGESPSRQPGRDEGDAPLKIIGIGASAKPTDIARDELEYLAEAYASSHR
jgi:hypothetical protein